MDVKIAKANDMNALYAITIFLAYDNCLSFQNWFGYYNCKCNVQCEIYVH